jgi:ABC-type sulfate/molybdate transport systems ATPase subunit
MLSGLETPDSGTIYIGDKVVFDAKTNLPPNQRDIAIVFQNYAQNGKNFTFLNGKRDFIGNANATFTKTFV